MTRTCNTCSNTIGQRSRTGRCAACANADPAVRARKGSLTPEQRERRAIAARALSANPDVAARRGAASRAALASPEAKARHKEACLKAGAARRADPVKMERMREIGRLYGAANTHTGWTPEARATRAANIRAARLRWCPEEHWPTNEALKRAGYRLPERKQMIAAEIAKAAARAEKAERDRIAAMTPHERAMAKVAAGARLVAAFKPTPTGHAFTLGGIATGMI